MPILLAKDRRVRRNIKKKDFRIILVEEIEKIDALWLSSSKNRFYIF
jgi:hypothetical protein